MKPVARLKPRKMDATSAWIVATLSEWSNTQPTNSVVPLVIDVIPDGCEGELPGAFQNLLNLLQILVNVGVTFGIILAVGGIVVSGILFLMPSVERNRQARKVFRYTLMGLVVVMMGPSVVGFIVGELNPLCG
jgi:hypothetical protein